MALSINTTLRDSASTASFEVTNDGAGAENATTIIDTANLTGARVGIDTQEIMVTKVIASVATSNNQNPALVTLAWGDGTEFLHLGPGVSEITASFRNPSPGASPNNDVTVTSGANVVFTLKVFVNKVTGFPLSMGHAGNRP